MNRRLVVPSAASLAVLAIVCGVTAQAGPAEAPLTLRTELAGHPAGGSTPPDTGTGDAPSPLGGVAGTANLLEGWRSAELLPARQASVRNSRAATALRRATLSSAVAKPVKPKPRPFPAKRNPKKAMPKARTESKASVAVRTALAQRGKPYVWGATGPGSFDCSGLMQYAYRRAGVPLPRVTWDQIQVGRRVPLSAIRPGDLVFYRSASHVGMYVGDGRMVHAPRSGTRIRTADLHLMRVYAVVRPY